MKIDDKRKENVDDSLQSGEFSDEPADQLSAVKKVRSGREEVPLRELKLQQDKASASLTLWREAAVQQLDLGCQCRITHLKSNMDAGGDFLLSTPYSNVEVEASV
ncbi:uncharacterized protein PAE49_012457 [Odontesthes bonariensis]